MSSLLLSVPAQTGLRLNSPEGLELMNAKAEAVTYRGRRAVRLIPLSDEKVMMAMVANVDFKDGTIEVEVAGSPSASAPPDARGFIGIAFRVQPQATKYECFYLRPTNGRADDQLRRNHSTQYISEPDYPWERLRKESPGVYESYVDLETGAWTKIKIVVAGRKARLYVNGSEQPCLIVNDLKLGESHGQVALWTLPATDGYFSNLTIK
ncbi:MAG: hypothetical protein JOZ52_02805 [Acidobacteria bacterium]|nr:hypothetical protein [Acidobacteriota bacterium]